MKPYCNGHNNSILHHNNLILRWNKLNLIELLLDLFSWPRTFLRPTTLNNCWPTVRENFNSVLITPNLKISFWECRKFRISKDEAKYVCKKNVPVNKTKVREHLYSVGDRNSCGVKMCASEGLLQQGIEQFIFLTSYLQAD